MRFDRVIAVLKVYLTRSNSYLTIINSGMILILLVRERWLISISMSIVLFIASIIGAIILGVIDHRLGIHGGELRIASVRNPVIIKMCEDLEWIKKKLAGNGMKN